MAEQKKTRILLKNVRLSYANIFEPKAMNEGDDPKYSVSLIIDKNDENNIKKIKQAIENAKANGKAEKFGGKVPANLRTPLRDGDTDREDDDAYNNAYFLNANSKQAPEVIDQRKLPATDADVYSGCYAHVTVNFYPYAVSGNKGIAVGLGNIMKAKDGERLSGGASAESDFADIDAEDDDDLFD